MDSKKTQKYERGSKSFEELKTRNNLMNLLSYREIFGISVRKENIRLLSSQKKYLLSHL